MCSSHANTRTFTPALLTVENWAWIPLPFHNAMGAVDDEIIRMIGSSVALSRCSKMINVIYMGIRKTYANSTK